MKEITIKAVDRMVEAMNDSRFRTHLFGSLMSDESEIVNEKFYQVILSYLREQARLADLGSISPAAHDAKRLLEGRELII